MLKIPAQKPLFRLAILAYIICLFFNKKTWTLLQDLQGLLGGLFFGLQNQVSGPCFFLWLVFLLEKTKAGKVLVFGKDGRSLRSIPRSLDLAERSCKSHSLLPEWLNFKLFLAGFLTKND